MGVATIKIALCFFALFSISFGAIPFKPLRTIDTEMGIEVQTYESNENNGIVYFAPTPKLHTWSINRTFDDSTKSYNLHFEVSLWDDPTEKKIRESVPTASSVSPLPAKDVRLILGSGFNSSQYSSSSEFLPLKESQNKVNFALRCSTKAACGTLRSRWNDRKSAGATSSLVLEFRSYSKLLPIEVEVSVKRHVSNTKDFRRWLQRSRDQLFVYEKDALDLVDEVLKNVLEREARPNAVFAVRADAVEKVKDVLFSVPDLKPIANWGDDVIWTGEIAKRPDNFAKTLNSMFSADLANKSLLIPSTRVSELDSLGLKVSPTDENRVLKSLILNRVKDSGIGWDEKFIPHNPQRAKMLKMDMKKLQTTDSVARLKILSPQDDAFAYQVPVVLDFNNAPKKLLTDGGGHPQSVSAKLEDLQAQINELKMRKSNSWPEGDYCLFFPAPLSQSSACPSGFHRVFPSEAAVLGNNVRGRNRPGLWIMNFACCRSQPADLPTSFVTL